MLGGAVGGTAGASGEAPGETQTELERLQAERAEQERILDTQSVIIQQHEAALQAARRVHLDAERRRCEVLERIEALRSAVLLG